MPNNLIDQLLADLEKTAEAETKAEEKKEPAKEEKKETPAEEKIGRASCRERVL